MEKLHRIERLLGKKKPLIMGILNVTPDSFYDGGTYYTTNNAIKHALEMADNGADILDIGGESSRPGAQPVSEEEELNRVLPVIEAITSKIPVTVSIDTCKANVARQALDAGAAIVNDISALCFDSMMTKVVAEHGSYIVLMHMLGNPRTMQKNPQFDNVVEDIFSFFNKRIDFAVQHGISKDRIIVDPGIGFGKTLEHNLIILRNIERFSEFGCPVLIGVSNKSMIGSITGASVQDRGWGTAAITSYCVIKGVLIHRVHDVKAIRQVCDIAYALKD